MKTAHFDTVTVDDRPRPLALRAVQMLRVHRALLVILAAGLLVRLVLLANSGAMPLQVVDEQHYAELAGSMAEGHGFAFKDGRLTSMRPPLYPAFMAAIWSLTGTDSYQAIRATQVLLGLLLTIAVYVLAGRLFDQPTAIIAAGLICFYPSFLFSGLLLLTEVLFTLLLVAAVLLFDRLLRHRQLLIAGAMGLIVGLAALTRSVLWPFPLILLPLIGAVTTGSWRRRTALALCCLAGYVAVVGPWAIRNSRLQGTTTIVDTMGGMNLRMGNYEFTPEDRMWDAVSITGERNWSYVLHDSAEARTWTDGQKEKWAQREALKYMAANPLTTIRRSVLKFADFWGLEREMIAGFSQGLYQPPTWFKLLASGLVLISYPLVMFGAVVGLFRTHIPANWTHALVILLVLFVAGIHSIVFGHSRYHLPLIALLTVYAAASLAQSPALARMTRGRVCGAVIACTVLVAIWGHEVFFRDADRLRALLGWS